MTLTEAIEILKVDGWHVMSYETNAHNMPNYAPEFINRNRFDVGKVIHFCIGRLGFDETVTLHIRDPYGKVAELSIGYGEAGNSDSFTWTATVDFG